MLNHLLAVSSLISIFYISKIDLYTVSPSVLHPPLFTQQGAEPNLTLHLLLYAIFISPNSVCYFFILIPTLILAVPDNSLLLIKLRQAT
jgi:hypothetical protein